MQRVLGIDYGTRRIGVAIADLETRVATPLTMIDGRNDVTRDASAIIKLANREQAAAIVVGLPLNMDGSDSHQTDLTRSFADELIRLGEIPVHLHDERLSSFAAQELLDAGGIDPRKQKGRLDAVAAQRILQSFLDRDQPQRNA